MSHNDNALRILLVEPPFTRLHDPRSSMNRLPLSLGYLAGAIVSNKPDWEVRIYNADFSPDDVRIDLEFTVGTGFDNYLSALREPGTPIWQEVRDAIAAFGPSVVGITAKSQTYASACMVARIAKSVDPSTQVVMGGPHPSLVRREVLSDPAVDIVAFGEGEETIVEILDSVESDRPLSSVRGIAYRDGSDVVENPPREPIADLDALALPVSIARDCLLGFDTYPIQSFESIFALRGCPYACTFCGSRNIWGRKVRFRSAASVVAEMLAIRQLGLNHVHFEDDTFGVRPSHIRELCRAIADECNGMTWSCEIHVKLVNEEIVQAMRDAGCTLIQLGVESGSDEILRSIAKDITVEEARAAAGIIKAHGIRLETFFMVGFPQETIQSLEATIQAIRTFPADHVVYSIFTPYMGTELFEECRAQGTIPSEFDVSLYNHQSPENYFCPRIPRDVFQTRVVELAKLIDRINSRQKLRQYSSLEGLSKLRQKGIRRGLARLLHFCRNAIWPK